MVQFNKTLTVFFCLIVTGCATTKSSSYWPIDIPERHIFIEAYHAKTEYERSFTPLENHLIWIKRFYQGTLIYSFGWLRMTEQLLLSLNSEADIAEAEQRLREMGIRIASEWAQPNKIRKINSANVSVWGNALRASAERGEQLTFIGKVERDIEDLLAQRLNDSEITYERYYPEDDYDNF